MVLMNAKMCVVQYCSTFELKKLVYRVQKNISRRLHKIVYTIPYFLTIPWKSLSIYSFDECKKMYVGQYCSIFVQRV